MFPRSRPRAAPVPARAATGLASRPQRGGADLLALAERASERADTLAKPLEQARLPSFPLLKITRALGVAVTITALASCGDPKEPGARRAQSSQRVAPIAAEAIQSLFEPGHFNASGNIESMYSSASPPECRALVLEVDSPLLMRGQVASASAIAPKPGDKEHAQIVEIAAVYREGFSATDVIAEAAAMREHCEGTPITGSTQGGGNSTFQLIGQPSSGSPNILLWTLSALGKAWFCNNALIAAHNAAVEITSCYPSPAPKMRELAQSALSRIERQARSSR
ncbi:sensor domain-containing protein [Segniliparus rotundus]|nr:sensor domain-containing protein [Segniliparus rotundus]